MKATRKLIICLLTLNLMIPAVISASTDPVEPHISAFTGETTPGIMTRMDLHWSYIGPQPEELTFRLYRMEHPDEAVLAAELPGAVRSYQDSAEPGLMSVTYRLEAMLGNSVVAEAETVAAIAHPGKFIAVEVRDTPYDGGGQIDINWQVQEPVDRFSEVRIYRTSEGVGGWELAGSAEPTAALFTDAGLEDGVAYNYMLRAYGEGAIWESRPVMNIISRASWFDMRKINLLVIAVIVMFAVTWYVTRAGRGKMYIRKIAGLQAVEEAVGRATEMGRSVLFIPGILDLDDVQTIAGLTILGSVAKMTAEYETRLDVPVSRSLVMSNGREMVKEAYLSVGRPDFYNDDIVHYVTDEQFGYVAAVDGIMVREQPAACFYMGAFFAESLILAETGNYVGAIQIAGTAMPSQLPFFVAACDYTLIGEELFAASAYLSGDQRMIASLRGQDVGKVLAMGSIVLGSVLATVATLSGAGFWMRLSDAFVRLFALNF